MEALEAIIPVGDFAVGVASCRETRMVYDYYPRCQSRSVYLIYGVMYDAINGIIMLGIK